MENNLSNENQPDVEESNHQKEVKKRISYISRDHKSMIDFVSVIYRNLGHADYHSNKTIATEHGLSADSIKQQITSSQQYKLLELKFGTGYKITDLFKTIFLPLNDIEKKTAIIESLKAPEIYTELFQQYEGHVLPPLNGLKNHFVRKFHFKEDIAEKTADIFINNLREYGLLDARGVLNTVVDKHEPEKTFKNKDEDHQKIEEKRNPIEPKVSIPEINPNGIDIVIPLKSGKGKAHLLLPEDYTEEDLVRIAKFVEALK